MLCFIKEGDRGPSGEVTSILCCKFGFFSPSQEDLVFFHPKYLKSHQGHQ